jgi:hypothetical protein
LREYEVLYIVRADLDDEVRIALQKLVAHARRLQFPQSRHGASP